MIKGSLAKKKEANQKLEAAKTLKIVNSGSGSRRGREAAEQQRKSDESGPVAALQSKKSDLAPASPLKRSETVEGLLGKAQESVIIQ